MRNLKDNGEIQNQVKFRAKIQSQKRITVPSRLVDFNIGDKVIVILKKVEAET